jgi:hypothetical protein
MVRQKWRKSQPRVATPPLGQNPTQALYATIDVHVKVDVLCRGRILRPGGSPHGGRRRRAGGAVRRPGRGRGVGASARVLPLTVAPARGNVAATGTGGLATRLARPACRGPYSPRRPGGLGPAGVSAMTLDPAPARANETRPRVEITIDDLLEQCPECKGASVGYGMGGVSPPQPGFPGGTAATERSPCQRCNNHGRILTAAGRALQEFLTLLGNARPGSPFK